MKPRKYQIKLTKKCSKILSKKKIVYLVAQMRVGKTLVSLHTAGRYFNLAGISSPAVLFFTKKHAIPSIKSDYEASGLDFKFAVTNYEQAHKVDPNEFDLIIVDEAHNLGAFPKPSKRTKLIKKVVGSKPLILLSGTPTPESYSQIFHQLWISDHTPFHHYKSFYKWAVVFVKTFDMKIGSHTIKDYSNANWDMIKENIDPYTVSFTQVEAGIDAKIKDKILTTELNGYTQSVMKSLLTDKVYEDPEGWVVLGDTPVKLRSKIHQLCSGTVKDEDGIGHVLDQSKAYKIYNKFQNNKIGIFYLYKAEAVAINYLTIGMPHYKDPEEFNSAEGPAFFMSQIQSGSEGISLRGADVIIFYNIPYSARQFIQARARQQDKRRKKKSKVIWLFSDCSYSIEEKIHKLVTGKMDYTTKHFVKDYLK